MPTSSNELLQKPVRLRQLDFLRGLAILLVLFRHKFFTEHTQTAGWIGVDLFFVLSGFLVSGLLFREHARFGNIKPGLFLIRRGFKIYPLYYLFYLPYLLPILWKGTLDVWKFLAEMVFLQNYVNGWGYAYAPSWSLAVEEHFYFGFAMLALWAVRRNWLPFQTAKGITAFEGVVVALMALAFGLRVYSQSLGIPVPKLMTMTHLRMDSLLAGVLISFWFYYRHTWLESVFAKSRTVLWMLAVLLLAFTPFRDYTESVWVRTIGLTMLYVSFAIILASFLTDKNINAKLDDLLSKWLVDGVARIGFASYSIYIIHSFVNYAYAVATGIAKISVPSPVSFVVTSAVSIAAGFVMTQHIEKYFLSLRDRWFPARAN